MQWSDFLDAWPSERVREMALEEYTNSDRADAFIYWLEARLDMLGSIWGGSAFKFGIYHRSDTEPKKTSRGRMWGDTYAWLTKFGIMSMPRSMIEATHAAKQLPFGAPNSV